MMTALILAASVSISSPEIGNFFRLPAWMPTSVPSDRTFGSKDMTNATHRIDDMALAAVNACFEAWCERCYFAHCGNSNVWDVAEFGPTTLDGFQFSKSPAYGIPQYRYTPDTNRTAKTRRFVEYDNIDGLAAAMIYGPGGTESESQLRPRRPLWSDETVYWSSTLFDDLDLGSGTSFDRDPPTCGWLSTLSFVLQYPTNQWPVYSMTWQGLADRREVDPVDWTKYAYYVLNIPVKAIGSVNYGERDLGTPVSPGYYAKYMGEDWRATNTTMDVIGRGIVITNIVESHVRSYIEVGLNDPNPYSGGSDTIKEQLEEVIADYFGRRSVPPHSFSGRVYFRRESILSYDVHDETVTAVYPWLSGDIELPDGLYQDVISIMFDSVDLLCRGLARRSDINYVDIFPSQAGQIGLPYSYDATSGSVAVESAADVIADVEAWYDKSAFSYYAGVEGLTNSTRRLVTDRLAGIGYALSALDRTYSRIALPYADHGITNRVVTAGKLYRSSSFPVEVLQYTGRFVTDHMEYDLNWQEGDYLPTPVDAVTNVTETGLGCSPSPDDSCVYRVYQSRAQLSRFVCGVTDASVDPRMAYDVELDAEDNPIVSAIRAGFSSDVDVGVGLDVSFGEDGVTTKHFVFDPNTFVPYAGIEPTLFYVWPYPEDFGDKLMSSYAEAGTTYTLAETVLDKKWRDGFPTYPGDFSRVGSAKLWGFSSYAYAEEDPDKVQLTALTYPWGNIRGDAPAFTNAYTEFKYKMDAVSYSSEQGCRSAFDALTDRLVEKCRDAEFDVIPDPKSVYGHVERGILDAHSLSHIFPVELKFVTQFDPNLEWWGAAGFVLYSVRRVGDDMSVSCGGWVYYDSDSGHWKTNQVSKLRLGGFSSSVAGSAAVDSDYVPHDTPYPGRGVNSKLDVWSKVDWNWKALKRGD